MPPRITESQDASKTTTNTESDAPRHDDPDAPAELLPVARSYATEKLSYEVLLFEQLNEPSLRPLDGPLDLSVLEQPTGFSQPATGALLTFEQEWVPFGLSLGQLLHSLALAPGEHTHIAVLDWNRREQASRQEDTQQHESLSHEITQRRSISETAEMVKKELQEGTSEIAQQSDAAQQGMAFGASWAGMNLGASASSAKNTTLGRAVTSSRGRREISAHLQSQISSLTQQHAASVRNRRASVITEVQQQEKETLQTRTIANYNHSHALSIHYYEVVQIYRTTTRLKRCERCLFLPMKRLDFDNPRLLRRYRDLFWRYAREPRLRSLLEKYLARQVEIRWLPTPAEGSVFSERSQQHAQRKLTRVRLRSYRRSEILDARIQIHSRQTPHASVSFSLQKDARSETALVTFEQGYPLEELQQISLFSVPSRASQDAFTVELFLGHDTTPFASARLEAPHTESAVWPLLSFGEVTNEAGHLGEEISVLLNEDALYYSQAVWQHLTQTEIAMLFSGYRFEGGALLESIDPQPISVYGNFLVFRSPLEVSSEEDVARLAGERQEAWQRWQAWMRKHADFAKEDEAFVPVATGGTFAEAVLGRFNASEKIDMTRFWDWQDSPIPLQATAIQPLASGTRKSEVSPETGKLEAPVVNILNPPALPNPQSAELLASLNALGGFRDMSGLTQAATLAQQGLQTVGAGARDAGRLASENMKAAIDLEKAKLQALAGLLGGKTAHKGLGSLNSSKAGALLNQGKRLDASNAARAKTLSETQTEAPSNPPSGGEGTTYAPSWEEQAYQSLIQDTSPSPPTSQPADAGLELASRPPRTFVVLFGGGLRSFLWAAQRFVFLSERAGLLRTTDRLVVVSPHTLRLHKRNGTEWIWENNKRDTTARNAWETQLKQRYPSFQVLHFQNQEEMVSSFQSLRQEKIDLFALFSHGNSGGLILEKKVYVEQLHFLPLSFREDAYLAMFSCSLGGNAQKPTDNSFAKELSLRLNKQGIFSFFKAAYFGKAMSEFAQVPGLDVLRTTSKGQFLLWEQGKSENLSGFVDIGMKGNYLHQKGSFDQVIRRLRFLWDAPPSEPNSTNLTRQP